jgi:pimeloyl-ACP methyl ester carboxylesterase
MHGLSCHNAALTYAAMAHVLAFFAISASPLQDSCLSSHLSWDQQAEETETLVQVGEYRLNFRVIEGGRPIVLLEAGGGFDSRQWNSLAPRLAETTGATVVSYDRAGFGKSDLPDTPLDMREELEWLWRGLGELNLNRDLILVGHSFGGWLIRLFASEHPEAVRGMVFVDAFTNELVDLLGVEYLDDHPMLGRLPFDTSATGHFTPMQRALIRMVGSGLGPKMETMRGTSIPPGVPVVVIASGRPFLLPEEDNEAWRLAQERMAASIEGAAPIVAEESGHMIPAQQPDLILEAVTAVMLRADSLDR